LRQLGYDVVKNNPLPPATLGSCEQLHDKEHGIGWLLSGTLLYPNILDKAKSGIATRNIRHTDRIEKYILNAQSYAQGTEQLRP